MTDAPDARDEQLTPPESEAAPTPQPTRPLRRSEAATQRYRRDRDAPNPQRERVAELIAALGDTTHPLHASAVDLLVEIGSDIVPQLNEVLRPQGNWLAAYRAAEVAGRLADGRAVAALTRTLAHTNSNVRWSVVRALAQIGDLRSIIELRRIAERDQGRTSWGESVSGTAQSALEQIRQRSVWGQGLELIKTAITAAVMVAALIFAFSVITTLREDFDRFGQVPAGTGAQGPILLPTLTATPNFAAIAAPTSTVTPSDGSAPSGDGLAGTILLTANVRPAPNTANEPIGQVNQGDQIIFVGRTEDNQWYLIELGELRAENSAINSPDQRGWINQALVSPPTADVPVVVAEQ